MQAGSDYVLGCTKNLTEVEKAIYAAVSDAILTAETSLQMVRRDNTLYKLHCSFKLMQIWSMSHSILVNSVDSFTECQSTDLLHINYSSTLLQLKCMVTYHIRSVKRTVCFKIFEMQKKSKICVKKE